MKDRVRRSMTRALRLAVHDYITYRRLMPRRGAIDCTWRMFRVRAGVTPHELTYAYALILALLFVVSLLLGYGR